MVEVRMVLRYEEAIRNGEAGGRVRALKSMNQLVFLLEPLTP
jgi:hypothetical protein